MNIHSPHEPGGAAAGRILLAEDNPVNRDLIEKTYQNVLEALSAIRQERSR